MVLPSHHLSKLRLMVVLPSERTVSYACTFPTLKNITGNRKRRQWLVTYCGQAPWASIHAEPALTQGSIWMKFIINGKKWKQLLTELEQDIGNAKRKS